MDLQSTNGEQRCNSEHWRWNTTYLIVIRMMVGEKPQAGPPRIRNYNPHNVPRVTTEHFIGSKEREMLYLHGVWQFKNILIPPVIVPGPSVSVVTPVIVPIVVVSLPIVAVSLTFPVIRTAGVTSVVRARIVHPIGHGKT
jgi:hypothetical protein